MAIGVAASLAETMAISAEVSACELLCAVPELGASASGLEST